MGAFMKNYDSQPAQTGTEILTGTQSKKPYQKPARRREKVFETTALSCGKRADTQAACKYNKKAS
jgi:hypothetical protein